VCCAVAVLFVEIFGHGIGAAADFWCGVTGDRAVNNGMLVIETREDIGTSAHKYSREAALCTVVQYYAIMQ
jgi:hypothetical protein